MMSSSSSDSDASERIKNIKSVLIKTKYDQQEVDESCAYKQKLGDLIFDAHYETGNLGYVEQIDENEYDLMIRPDVANPRHRLWFNFRVSNQRPNQCVIFTIVNLSDDLTLFHEGFNPVVRSRQQPNWIRLHEDQVFYYKSSNHGHHHVLSIAFRFSSYDNEHQFALLYPYAFSNLMGIVSRWAVELKRIDESQSDCLRSLSPDLYKNKRLEHLNVCEKLRSSSSQGFNSDEASKSVRFGEDVNFKAEILGTSIISKPIYLLTIKGTVVSRKAKVVVLCRTGGNLDGPASIVCQGLLDFILSDNLCARIARQYMEFLIFPMMDPDSISSGNSRSDIFGQSKFSFKLLKTNGSLYHIFTSVRNKILELHSEGARIILIELGVNLNLLGSRVKGSYYDDSLRMERHLSFPRLLTRFANDFYLENCEFIKHRYLGSSTGLFDFSSENQIDSYKLEVSPYAWYKRSLMERVYEEYDQQKYLSLGKSIVYTLIELLKPKGKVLPVCVSAFLDAFQTDANDIDDLVLDSRE